MSNIFRLDGTPFGDGPLDDETVQSQRRRKIINDFINSRPGSASSAQDFSPPLSASPALKAATPILLFHVSYGRNAWNSTWISRYTPNTLLASISEAEALVQEKLKQGTAFRMTVIPGWHLQFDGRAYLITEINTHAPFARLRAPRFTSAAIAEQEALSLLRPDSDLWRGECPAHDSVIVQESNRGAQEFIQWKDRTHHPHQVATPGYYKRKIDGKHWWLGHDADTVRKPFDTTAYEALVNGISVVSAT